MKRTILSLLSVAFTMIFIESCGYTYETVTAYDLVSAESDYNQKYIGYTKTQIINANGAPDRIVPIEGNSVILVYETITTRVDPPFDPLGLGLGSAEVRSGRWFEEYYMDNDSKCYKVKTNKVKTVPYEKVVKKSRWNEFWSMGY